MRKWKKFFYGLDIPFSLKIFLVAAFGGVVASIAGSITSLISGLPFSVVVITLLGGLASLILMVVANLLTDLAYKLVDPRISFE